VLGPTDILVAIGVVAVIGPVGAIALYILMRRFSRSTHPSKERP
jgi:hypothetical protein